MAIGRELALSRQATQRVLLPDRGIALDPINHRGIQHKETAVDPTAIALGLLLEATHGRTLAELQGAVAAWGLNGRHRGKAAMLLVMGDQSRDVHIRDAISIGEAEVFIDHVVTHSPEAAAGHRSFAGIHQGDFPGLRFLAMDLHRIGAHVEGHVAHVQEVISEILLDYITLVSTTDDKFIDAVGAEDLEDVPKNRPPANFDHWFGLQMSLFANTSAKATGKNNSFHRFSKFGISTAIGLETGFYRYIRLLGARSDRS